MKVFLSSIPWTINCTHLVCIISSGRKYKSSCSFAISTV
ncbi:hypothetical protein IJM86_00085 [bacterium]|nr:hypothetical protein [bacterium]